MGILDYEKDSKAQKDEMIREALYVISNILLPDMDTLIQDIYDNAFNKQIKG